MEHYTIFNKRSIIVRNNVKNSMIKNFLKVLDVAIAECESSVTTAYSSPSEFAIPHYDKSGIDPCSKVSDGDLPCLNTDCEWLAYQSLVYTTPMWQLPAVSNDGLCFLCLKERGRSLDWSKIRKINEHKIVLMDENQ